MTNSRNGPAQRCADSNAPVPGVTGTGA
jgi:hypothetical protein